MDRVLSIGTKYQPVMARDKPTSTSYSQSTVWIRISYLHHHKNTKSYQKIYG